MEINEDQMTSLIDGIYYLWMHPEATPEMNHENWMKMKQEQGWKYGKVKDFETKTHPDLVPYDQLEEIEKKERQIRYDRAWRSGETVEGDKASEDEEGHGKK